MLSEIEIKKTCCFIGNRKTVETEALRKNLFEIIENLIVEKEVTTFLFGSKSGFDNICYDIVDDLKEKYIHIERIFVRAEFPHISEDYRNCLLQFYEDTYYPKSVLGANRAVYIKRNYEMIDKSDYCVIYYNEKFAPATRKSGAKISLDYAIKRKKKVFILS